MRKTSAMAFTTMFVLSAGAVAFCQERNVEVAGVFGATFQHELDATDLGFGGRVGFRLAPLFVVEGEIGLYPADLPDAAPVTTSRLEGLFGVKIGPRFDRFAVFGKVRPGFLRFAGAPGPFACILIYPPPLDCILAQGRTVFALDLGGGVELYPSTRSLVRVDVSDLLLRYPGPAFRRGGRGPADHDFWGGNLRLTFAAGLRF